jgi:hypothetical protein
MPNTDPEAIRVANEKIRTLADIEQRRYHLLKSLQLQAVQQGWIALYPNDSEEIIDGSATDGRQTITNAQARAFLLDMATAIADLEAGGNARLNLSAVISVNPHGRLGALGGD